MSAKRKPKQINIGFWTMVRDVLVHSINKGQFPVALIGSFFVLMILRMPPEDVSKLMFRILDNIINSYLLGYICSFLFAIGWMIHSRWQRANIASEMARISNVRNQLQKSQSAGKIESSEEN